MQADHSQPIEFLAKKNPGIEKAEFQVLFQSNNYEISVSEEDENQDISDVTLDNKSKNQVLLYWKIQELQQTCELLIEDNKRLSNKIQQLAQETQSKVSRSLFTQQDSEINQQFTDVEQLLKEYRENLVSFQVRIQSQNKKKNEKIKDISQKLDEVVRKKQEIDKICKLQDKEIKQKANQLMSLKKQLQEKDMKISELLNKKIHRKESSNTQNQLVSLIEKLVVQLQQQREEKATIENDLQSKQKQLSEKNIKIRHLQMQLLRYEKSGNTHEIQNVNSIQTHINAFNYGSKLKCFSLQQIISKPNVTFSIDKIFLLVRKIIQHYYQKFQNSQYVEIVPENLLIFDYHSESMNMFAVRQSSSYESFIRDKTLNKNRLMANMANILMNILDKAEVQGLRFKFQHQTKQKLKENINQTLKQINSGHTIDQFDILAQLLDIIDQYTENNEQLRTNTTNKLLLV